MTLQNYQNLK